MRRLRWNRQFGADSVIYAFSAITARRRSTNPVTTRLTLIAARAIGP